MLEVRRAVTRDRPKASIASLARLGASEIYPLDAPGMPVPGPDFLEQVRRTGQAAELKKVKIELEDGSTQTVTKLEYNEALYQLHQRALRDPNFAMPVTIRAGLRKSVPFVPGHIWGQHLEEYTNGNNIPTDGPAPAKVMVIGKMPGPKEVQDGRCMLGETGRLLLEMLRNLHVKGMSTWYVTNLCKFMPPDGITTMKAGWIKDCLPLLHQELRLVRPDYILCLGADASKALLGKSFGVSNMEGRVIEYKFPLNFTQTESPEQIVEHEALVMTVVHPAQVSRAPDTARTLERGLARFKMLTEGIRFDKAENDTHHVTIRTFEELDNLLYEIDNDPKNSNVIAVDAEWHGEHPVNRNAYVRTIQLAWRPKFAAAIVLNDVKGEWCLFSNELLEQRQGLDPTKKEDRAVLRQITAKAKQQLAKRLNKFFANKRIGGHFFVADLEWLDHLGITQAKKSYYVPIYDKPFDEFGPRLRKKFMSLGYSSGHIVPAWVRTKFEGGFDTGLRAHAIEETAQLGLEALAVRYTTAPRYDIPLQEWKVAYCKQQKMKAKDLEGYGPCPDDVLIPYGIYDADVTLRLFYEQEILLDSDYEGNCCREPAWESQLTTLPILEMHQTGLGVDKAMIDELTVAFSEARTIMETKIQEWAKWPEFNIRSVIQVREFLFGHELNGKRDKEDNSVRVRPEEARSLYLEPLLDTSKPPRQWIEIKEAGKERDHSPGTGKTILGVLAQENEEQSEQVQWIRDYRFLDQVLKGLLRPPRLDDKGMPVIHDNSGNVADASDDSDDSVGSEPWAQGLVFDAGLATVICDDGRVRTHLYPTTETGRWRSARPNLQNVSKRRDADYERLLGAKYKHKLRSIITSIPGHVLVEADFIGAELYGMAIMSGDVNMIEHCRRNQLPEDDPDFYDIHSNVARLAFGLECEPTKSALKAAGKSHLRIVAKTVIFGIAYGRGAKAVAFEAKQEGIQLSVYEAQRVIDTIFNMYPGLVSFFQECRQRAIQEGWLCNCFGRFRRFPQTSDTKMQGEFERQAQNYPIQSLVASCVDRAVAHLMYYRDHILQQPDLFRFALQIHDALMLHVPYKNVELVAEDILPRCMGEMVPIYPTDLAGIPTGAGPYHLGVEVEVGNPWGEKLTAAFASEVGIPLKYAAKVKAA